MKNNQKGFTLIEIVITMGIISILLASISFAFVQAIERMKVNRAVSDIQAIRQAVEQYHADMGFYPSDRTLDVDPGLGCEPGVDAGCVAADCISTCPVGFNSAILSSKWSGPYMKWPDSTPWGGVYDYDYWGGPTLTYACGAGTVTLPRSIYLTIRNSGTSTISVSAEQYLIDKGIDSDGCTVPNGVIHFLIKRL